jgi:hypothetical protein
MDAREARQTLTALFEPAVLEALRVLHPDRASRERLSDFDAGVVAGTHRLIDLLGAIVTQQGKAAGAVIAGRNTPAPDSLIRQLEAKGSVLGASAEGDLNDSLDPVLAEAPSVTPTAPATVSVTRYRATLPKEAPKRAARRPAVDSELARLLRDGVRVRTSER